jgi:uncharacterized repeat protein (TIGR03943 family)
MTAQAIRRFKALILILMALFFAEKYVSGKLYFYIGPRFGWLAIVAVGLLVLLAGSYNLVARQREGHDHDHDEGERAPIWPLLIVALPLALGTIIPARPLGASAVPNRGVATDMAVAVDQSGSRLSIVPSERNLLDWVRLISANPDPAALDGEEADVLGFVYRDPRFGDDQFMVARFTITCCVADALAIGVVVSADDASEYPTDTWVRVQGSFHEGVLDGTAMPVLVADEITPVQPPEQPYLYP